MQMQLDYLRTMMLIEKRLNWQVSDLVRKKRLDFSEIVSFLGKLMEQNAFFHWIDMLAANILLRSSTDFLSSSKYQYVVAEERAMFEAHLELSVDSTVGISDLNILMLVMNGFPTAHDENPTITVRSYDMTLPCAREEKSDS